MNKYFFKLTFLFNYPTILIFLSPTLILANSNQLKQIPSGNSAWVYDTVYNQTGQPITVVPGLFSSRINAYNANASIGHKLTQLFSYGGDMEMYCQGSGGSLNTMPCTAQTMQVFYNPSSTSAYYDNAQNTFFYLSMYPIIDGVIGSFYLKNFNSLSQRQAAIYADNVAKLYCADDLVDGVQMDLEPFDITQPGQAFFYSQLAKDLAGLHDDNAQLDPYRCVNVSHSEGRIFSIFTFANKINANLALILNQYQNGYIIDSLYDLGITPAGTANSIADYKILVAQEIKRMINRAQRFNVKYQFGIPAAASTKEFESVDGTSSGVKQIEYVKAAIDAINASGARNDPLFRGINLWSYSQKLIYGNNEYQPSFPPAEVLTYLGNNL